MKSHAQLIREEIERKGMDGLWCAEVPCGCLKDDLRPCGMPWEEVEGCSIGKRMDYTADEKCGCDGEGTAHFHVCAPDYEKPTLPIPTVPTDLEKQG